MLNIKQIKWLNFVAFLFYCGSWRIFVVAVGAFSLWQLALFRCGSWRNSVVAVGGNAKLQKATRAKGIFREIRCTFREFKSYIRYDRYYKPITFSSFTLNTIKFCTGTFAIPDIFPNFASTFLTDEMNMKIQL